LYIGLSIIPGGAAYIHKKKEHANLKQLEKTENSLIDPAGTAFLQANPMYVHICISVPRSS
jgi:hypothetical protein